MSASFDILASLFHHRWAVPALAELHRAGGGAKFITLLNRLGVSRPSLKRTLDHLVDAGWIKRNPGYGHPMRPEYLQTDAGRLVGPHCARLMRLLRRAGLEETGQRKWPLCIAALVGSGAHRFSEMRTALPDITARALTMALKNLQHAAMIERTVYDETPPVVEYTLSRRARTITDTLMQLARAADRARAA